MKYLRMINSKEQTGITLIALVVTIIVLIILAGVSINMLVGENGIINMAQRAKNETEQAAKDEQQALASAFERNYVTYNGQLHVEGRNLINENGEKILLNGLVLDTPMHYVGVDVDFLIKSAKDWGVNIIRVGLSTTDYLNENKEESMKQLDRIINSCIENDLYILLVFFNNDVINNIPLAKEYFSIMADKYKNYPNFLYEIDNEVPLETTWAQVTEYSNEIIPIVRKFNQNSIVVVGTPNVDTRPDEVIGNELNFTNIMYAVHFYPTNVTDNTEQLEADKIDRINESILNNLPIIVTEWSAGSSNGTRIDFEIATKFVKLMADYNISWLNYSLNAEKNSFSILKTYNSEDILGESNLTENGKWVKNIFLNDYSEYEYTISDYTLYSKQADQSTKFFVSKYRENIINIFITEDYNISDEAIKIWNLSQTGFGKIIGYITKISDDSEKYNLYICSDKEIFAPEDCGYLFAYFTSLEKIDLSLLNTDNVKRMDFMFTDCPNLKDIIGLNEINTNNVKTMESMFGNCTQLEELNLSNWQMKNVENMNRMFLNDTALTMIDFSNAEFNSNLTEYMFAGANPTIIVKSEKERQFLLSIKEQLNVKILE